MWKYTVVSMAQIMTMNLKAPDENPPVNLKKSAQAGFCPTLQTAKGRKIFLVIKYGSHRGSYTV
jgi:hypothetical protein